jgi:hypothetical protein
MLMKPVIVLEYFPATATIVMTGLEVFLQVTFVCEMFVAVLAIIVTGALNPVLFQTNPRGEVNFAVATDIMS